MKLGEVSAARAATPEKKAAYDARSGPPCRFRLGGRESTPRRSASALAPPPAPGCARQSSRPLNRWWCRWRRRPTSACAAVRGLPRRGDRRRRDRADDPQVLRVDAGRGPARHGDRAVDSAARAPRANSIPPEDVDSRPAWPRTSRPAGRVVDLAVKSVAAAHDHPHAGSRTPSGSAAPAAPRLRRATARPPPPRPQRPSRRPRRSRRSIPGLQSSSATGEDLGQRRSAVGGREVGRGLFVFGD